MCERFSFSAGRTRMKRVFNIDVAQPLQASYNIGPGNNAYVLTNKSTKLQIYRWGLVPRGAKDPGIGLSFPTAKAEGIEKRHSFRMPIRQHRCLVFADSFYVWEKSGQAHRILLPHQELMAFAGIWEHWEGPRGQLLKTFSLITVPANNELQALGQEQMPVLLLDGEDLRQWLVAQELSDALRLLQPLPSGILQQYPIGAAINQLENDFADLQRPLR